jgi:Flp pilus assembly pilin Flp
MSIRAPAVKDRRQGLGERGSVMIEFGLLAPIVVTLLVGVIEIGMTTFVQNLLEASVREASRFGITGRTVDGVTREQAILDVIEDRTIGLVDMSKAQVEMLVYPNFGSIGASESYIDGNGNGAYDVGETFTDLNGNGTREADIGVTGPGAAGQVVLYRISYDWEILTPFATTFIGQDGKIRLSASVAVRNEPWGTTP